MKNYIIIVAILVISNCISYFVGSHTIFMAADVHEDGTETIMYPHWFNTQEALDYEYKYANALIEGLHWWYSSDDNDYWFEVFMKTPEYNKIDSLNFGNWEDFYLYETPRYNEEDSI